MGILAPLALVTLPLVAAIVALYLLKLRRPIAPVGSLFLWESLTRDREANSLWQRLRVSVLLVLQLLAILALVLALARPWVTDAEPVDKHLVIVVDVSASMAATDADDSGSKTRLQAAKEKANSLIDGLPQDGSAALIAADTTASLLVPPTSDKARLRDAVNGLVSRPSATDMAEAMKLAAALSAQQQDSSLWVLSDGAFPPVQDPSERITGAVHFAPFGKGTNNAGISALSLQQNAGNLQLFVQVVSSSTVTVSKRIDFTVDDQPWTARTVDLGPGADQELVLDDVPLQAHVVEAQLDDPDSLATDDKAWVVNRASVPANVLLVTGGDKFLELALSLLPNVNLFKVDPRDYRSNALLSGEPPDLTIFDAAAPTDLSKDAPQGNMLLIAPPPQNGLVAVTGVISDPVPTLAGSAGNLDSATGDQSSLDPLLRYVDLSGTHIAQAEHLELPAWAHTVLGSDQGPLIIAGQKDGHQVGIIGFDLHNTDLPLQTAFPLLVRNLVTALLPDPTGGLPAEVAPGTAVGIQALDQRVDHIIVEDPSANEWTYSPNAQGRVAFPETALLGVYYVSQYSGADLLGQEAFAMNLFSRDESMIAPNPAPGLPKGTLASAPAESAQNKNQTFQREIWPLVAFLGIVVLLAEWAYAQRIVIRRAIVEWRAKRNLERSLRAE